MLKPERKKYGVRWKVQKETEQQKERQSESANEENVSELK